jgi:hypothetical protein
MRRRLVHDRRRIAAIAAIAVLALIGTPLDRTGTVAAAGGYVSLDSPVRLLDTRPGESTGDGAFAGQGLRGNGSTLELAVAGRLGVPADVASVVLNVTVTDPVGAGFITVHPCDSGRPNASNLNYEAGQTVANLVIARVGAGGTICIVNGAPTHVIVDVTGYFSDATSFVPLGAPARLLDTRPGESTIDGLYAGIGRRLAGSAIQVPIGGRAGVPATAAAVVLNVTVTDPTGPGFATLYPCEAGRPNASNLNFRTGQTVPNAVVARLGVDGSICLFTQSSAHLLIDVAGYFANSDVLVPLGAPARLLDTRPGESTVDGQYRGSGLRPAGGTLQLQVAGRAGVPADASAVVLNVTATETQGPGVVTVYPTGAGRPNASNLNFVAGQTVPNAVTARLGAGGNICLFTIGSSHLIVDVAGYIVGTPPPGAGPACPADPVVPTPTTPTTPTTVPATTVPTTTPANSCHPSYVGACVPIGVSDVDCLGGGGNGPFFVKGPLQVIGPDPYRLDSDGDGIACE